ncbi:Putative multidrug export ATP-binding/permease protein SAV1866 [Gemella morbillorum]|uniref:ABC transporter ATP-binding protein n=1 Tax=Gemella morbillorum TaxID=29391 RepID=UPI000DA31C37|nr:ABC transporter ATP-binding protein [Gemella morbillorum]UBH81351.1 ABC transporter ATP-binding protein/permease [Gemella morbillorum]SQH55117.1 Putative multidrug export ATP-binding/permease protein SAV1866 [Gemella morbillorum]
MSKEKKQKRSDDFGKTLKRIIKLIFKKYMISSILVVLFALISTVFGIVGPKIMGQATTKLFEGLVAKINNTGGIDFEKIAGILLTVLGLYVLSSMFMFVEGWLMSNISQRLTYDIRKDISKKINTLPMGYFEQRTVGETLSRVTNDVDTLGQSLNQSFTQIIANSATVLGVLVMMFTISPLMTLIAIALIPISGILLGILTKMSQKYFTGQQKALADVNGQVEESYAGQNIIVAFNHKDKSIKEFNTKNSDLYTSSWKANFLSGLMFPVINFVGNLGYVGIVFSGGLLVAKGTIGVGDIQAFIQYIRNFTQPIGQIAQSMTEIQKMAAAGARVFEFLDAEDEVPVENSETIVVKEGNVVFDHVKFGYVEDQIIIKNFTSDVKKGEMIAIVGPTGAGKTTMVKLLMRFYDINGGKISIDGRDITSLSREELRSYFTMVLQDTWLFRGTIMENIRYGRLDATDEEVIEAAKAAHIHHFIKTLPGGYDMELNEEASNISQGQKQLLTIARAILANKPILILDEATSSVDTRTEVLIQKAMNKLMEGRTTFVIAHRLSTIRNADKILVLKDGDIIEQGNHNELLAQKGFYSELYQSQFAE